jgi:hypothetical protein
MELGKRIKELKEYLAENNEELKAWEQERLKSALDHAERNLLIIKKNEAEPNGENGDQKDAEGNQ